MAGPTLFTYMRQVQRFVRDAKQEMIDPDDIIDYVNRARREVAYRTQCLRTLTPISGQIMEITVTNPGSGYTNPVVRITPPDFPSGQPPYANGAQATAVATEFGGTIAGINMTFGGYGYWQPIVTITDEIGSGSGPGTGATATVSKMSFINQLNQGQEVYSFRDIDLTLFPGVEAVYMIKSVSLLYSNYRYSLPCYSFSTYQAMIRQYPFQYQYVPVFCAQYGQGTQGSFYMYPLPSEQYQIEFDCLCIPSDLTTDNDVEALPQPWTEAVPYWAAYLAFSELQNLNTARFYDEKFEKQLNIYSTAARPGRITNPYGRY